MNRLLGTTLFCAALGSMGISDAAHSADDSLAWLSGHWCLNAASMKTEEFWLPPAGGTLMGLSRTVKGERTVAFEFLRIAMVDGVVSYIAQPEGRPATVFKRTTSGDGWIRFENPQHDFPKRIEYRRTGEALHAEIAGPGKDGKEKVIPFEYGVCEK